MSNLSTATVFVMGLFVMLLLKPPRLPARAQRRRGRPVRPGLVQPAHEVRPLKRLDMLLLGTGLALAFAFIALLASR